MVEPLAARASPARDAAVRATRGTGKAPRPSTGSTGRRGHDPTYAAEYHSYLPEGQSMNTNSRYWQSVLREAESELEAATGRTALNAAAKKLVQSRPS